jgi:hypothetical protein
VRQICSEPVEARLKFKVEAGHRSFAMAQSLIGIDANTEPFHLNKERAINASAKPFWLCRDGVRIGADVDLSHAPGLP